MDKDRPHNRSGHDDDRSRHQAQAGRNAQPEPAGDAETQGSADDRSITEVSEDIHQQVLRERDEYLDSLKRLQADFDNYRKRVVKESKSSSGRVTAEIVEELLPVLDNFERAMQAAIEHDRQVLGDGVELVYRQLRDVLDRRGLCEITAEGEEFDPEHHEAVLCQPSDKHEKGKVVDVLEKGYRIEDRVVRPAKVIVSDGNQSG